MFSKFSLLLHKSRRQILAAINELLRSGYTAHEVKDILTFICSRKLTTADLRTAQSNAKKHEVAAARLKATQAARDDLQAQLDQRPPPSEAAQVLAEEFGHARSAAEWACLDKDGMPIPWYTYPMIEYLRGCDFTGKRVFEYGSGYSTLFWSARAGQIVSVEHDSEWYKKMTDRMPGNVEYCLLGEKNAYVSSILKHAEAFDIVIIDGVHREDCVAPALQKLKQDGLVILDNSDWHPGIASELRAADLIEVDMHGFGPINPYTWTTSIFFRRSAQLKPARARQPFHGPGSLPQMVDVSSRADIAKPSLNDLNDKLAKYLNYKNGFFIEVGANDGFNQSNTYYLENSLSWEGILIEAIPELAAVCRRTRARSKVYACALGSDPVMTPHVTMRYANLMSVVEDGMGSKEAAEAHVKQGLEVQGIEASYSVDVPVKTLTSILDSHGGIQKIDFFSLDVEGYEVEVLKGLDLGKYKPEYILVETSKLDPVLELLSSHYQMIEQLTHHDFLFQCRRS